MQEEFDRLASDIKRICQASPVYFFANPGNWGDGLIRQGAVAFLRQSGINYTELYRKPLTWIRPFLRGGVYIYGGSGAWCRFYNTGEKYTRLFSKRFKVIVLPSTFEKPFAVRNTIFYRRDEFESRTAMPNSTFCHDMAFYLGRLDLGVGHGAGYFFRLDAERNAQHRIPAGNFDLSRKGNQLTDTEPFFKKIAEYATVFTDRLHVAVAGCLMNREVHLYSNNYWKTKAIFRSSIAGNFPNCTFHEDAFNG